MYFMQFLKYKHNEKLGSFNTTDYKPQNISIWLRLCSEIWHERCQTDSRPTFL